MKVKPCPFCGEREELSIDYLPSLDEESYLGDHAVRCDNCGAMGPACSLEIEAEKSWNNRKEESNETV